MLGILEQAAFEEERVALQPGDRMLLYTDGITERANPGGAEFGVERLTALVKAFPAELSASEVTERILRGLDAFAEGVEPGDDQTLMVVRVRN
jgi:sigma-B regulation protein RsbU (phosphoserine phosphatase)